MNSSNLNRMVSVPLYTAVSMSVLFLLYMNLPYWYDQYQTSVTYAPMLFMLFIAAAVVLFITDIRQSAKFLMTPYAKWCIAVMLVHILNAMRVHILDFPENYQVEAIDRMQLFALAPTLAYLMFRVPSEHYSRLIGIVAILCPITLLANFAYPQIFETAELLGRENLSNRITGFWLNPNIAGEMVILALLMAYRHVNKNVYTVIVLACAAGILLTASRSGAVALLFITLPLLFTRRIPLWILGVFLGVGLSFQAVMQYIDNVAYDAGRQGTALVLLDRLDNQFAGDEDTSTESRLQAASVALSKSGEQFVIGHGYNYVDETWEIGTHNMVVAWTYLYGVVGLALWGYLAYALFVKTFNRYDLLLPLMVFVWYSMFSHNILQTTQWFIFLGWVFSVTPQKELHSRSHRYSDPRLRRGSRRSSSPSRRRRRTRSQI
ncbi:MAG: O-antigen ligase family protein [Granulosicoccus sp.]